MPVDTLCDFRISVFFFGFIKFIKISGLTLRTERAMVKGTIGEVCVRLDGYTDQSALLLPGVYALGQRGVVVYVGKAKCLLSRIAAHRSMWGRQQRGTSVPSWWPASARGIPFDEVHTFPCRVDQLAEVEAAMIELYKPRYNRALKTPGTTTAPISLTINGVTVGLNQPSAPLTRRQVA